MKMNPVNKIILKHEAILEEFIQWQIDYRPTSDFSDFAEPNIRQKDLPIYASILYKEYIEIEGVLLWKDHYSEDNWLKWRKEHSPLDAANVINHRHMDHFSFYVDDNTDLEDLSGELIAFFWNLALKAQYPNRKATVGYDGDSIYLEQSIEE